MRKAVLFLFHLLFLLVPLFFTAYNDELFEFNKIILTYVLTAGIVGCWFARMITERQWIWKKTPFDLPIGIFYCSQVLSTVFSIHPHTSIFGYYSRFNGGLLSITIYILLFYAFVSNVKREDLTDLVETIFYSAAITSVYAFLEHFGHSFSCLLISGQFDVQCWIQDVKTRVFSTFGQPNWLAAYLIMVIPLVVTRLAAVFSQQNLGRKIWYSALLALYFSVLLFTQSRSGLLGLFAGGLAYLTVFAFAQYQRLKGSSQQKETQRTTTSFIHAGFISAGIGAALIILFGTPFTPHIRDVWNRLTQKEDKQEIQQSQQVGTQLDTGGTESGAIRTIVWQGAINVWKRYPLLGSGVETFAYSYYKDRPLAHNMVSEWDFLYNKAHNEFLNYLATTGIVGFSAYLLMIGWIYVWSMRNAHHAPTATAAWLAAYTGLHVSNFFGFSTVVVSTLFFLVPAFIYIEAQNAQPLTQQKKKKEHNTSLNSYQWLFLAVVAGTTLYTAMAFVNMWRADAAYAKGKQLAGQGQGSAAMEELQLAVRLGKDEGVYHEELSRAASELAVAAYSQQQDATTAAQLGEFAIAESDTMIKLNPTHLNFYKSRARMFITLAQLAPSLWKEALATLDAAQKLAPTDPKITYNRALLNEQLGNVDLAVELLKQAIEMKPNYDGAKDQLKRILETPREP